MSHAYVCKTCGLPFSYLGRAPNPFRCDLCALEPGWFRDPVFFEKLNAQEQEAAETSDVSIPETECTISIEGASLASCAGFTFVFHESGTIIEGPSRATRFVIADETGVADTIMHCFYCTREMADRIEAKFRAWEASPERAMPGRVSPQSPNAKQRSHG